MAPNKNIIDMVLKLIAKVKTVKSFHHAKSKFLSSGYKEYFIDRDLTIEAHYPYSRIIYKGATIALIGNDDDAVIYAALRKKEVKNLYEEDV